MLTLTGSYDNTGQGRALATMDHSGANNTAITHGEVAMNGTHNMDSAIG